MKMNKQNGAHEHFNLVKKEPLMLPPIAHCDRFRPAGHGRTPSKGRWHHDRAEEPSGKTPGSSEKTSAPPISAMLTAD